MVVTWRLHLWIPTNLVLIQTSESVEKSLQHVAHYAVTLEAQFTHGLEEQALLGITGRPVCHLEQRIVGTLEQGLQSQFELRQGGIAHPCQRRGQTRRLNCGCK